MYMVAAAFIANVVYFIDGLHSFAWGVSCRGGSYFVSQPVGSMTNSQSCFTMCTNRFGGEYWSHSISSVRPSSSMCMCILKKSSGTTPDPVYRSCGVLYSCPGSGAYVSASLYTDGNAGYIAYDYFDRITGISCCPGAGRYGEVGSLVGSNVTAAGMVWVYSRSNASAMTDCYIRASDWFSDPSGTFVHTNNCSYSY